MTATVEIIAYSSAEADEGASMTMNVLTDKLGLALLLYAIAELRTAIRNASWARRFEARLDGKAFITVLMPPTPPGSVAAT